MVVEYFLEWVETAPVIKRVEAARALVKACLSNRLDEEEREQVDAAITVLLDDPAPGIRQAIAEEFGAFDTAPRHVMRALAHDNNDIATIVLSQSPVFHNAELIEFVDDGDPERQIAIACRPWMPETVMAAICKSACSDASLALLMNPAALLSGKNIQWMAERHGKDKLIRTILLERPDLPAEVRLILINKLGEALKSLVSERSWLPEARAQQTVREACDKASITFAAQAPEEDLERVVEGLIESGQLTTSYLLRAVCMGNITLAAKALSCLSGVRFDRVEAILTNNRESAFRAVYDRAGLPESAFNVFNCAISTWRRLLSSDSPINQSRLPFLVTREVLQSYCGNQDAVMDELLVLLRKLAAETARESARYKASEMIARRAQVVQLELDRSAPELSEEEMAIFAENLRLELDEDVLDMPTEFEPANDQKLKPVENPVDLEAVHEIPEFEPVLAEDNMDSDAFTLSQSVLHFPVQNAA